MRASIAVAVATLAACRPGSPHPWDGPRLEQPRTALTVAQLRDGVLPDLLDTSFLARPAWAIGDGETLAVSLALQATRVEADYPQTRAPYAGEDLFPTVTVDLVVTGGRLLPAHHDRIVTSSDSFWDVLVGPGAAWREADDGEWSRASLPIDLVDRYFNQVRNCVATFVYRGLETSDVYVQCTQETADLADEQVGDLRAMVPADLVPADLVPAELSGVAQAHDAREARRIPTVPLAAWDGDGELAELFDTPATTRTPTSVGAVYADGTLYVHAPQTRHGPHPYPEAMHHGVYSVSKSMLGTVAMLHLAERYGEDVFSARIADHVPALASEPAWRDVTLADALDMATGTNGGEDTDRLFAPLVLAETADQALANIAALGDAPEAAGTAFRYATTNTFVLSAAMQGYVAAREGEGVRAWDLVREAVLEPIGAGDLDVLWTRDPDPADRLPLLGFGARPTLDEAAKIARLLADDGVHEGRQLLHAAKTREALGRTGGPGLRVDGRTRYHHGLWRRSMRTGGCRVDVVYMQGHGGNHVLFLPSGVIVVQLTDELGEDIAPLVKRAERIRSSCG
ncbi:MAG: serine hydrolase [Myxococcales bacterium]|nr:serine hydrolase [Myxococcales bacterium]